MSWPRILLGTTLVAAALAGAAEARDEPRPFAAAIGDAIESCVDSSTIRFRQEDRRAILDPADTVAVSTALMRRYPVVEQNGLAPQRIAVWRKPDAGWLYVALLVNPAKPGEVCFTATFVASKVDVTAQVLEKYFGAGAAGE
ncbi:MAG: hypothetical protein ACXWCU_20225 [Caldimonas sp.]